MASTALIGDELQRMKAVLALEGATRIPSNVVAKKYFRARLPNGQIAGTVSSSEEAGDRRRDHLVHVNSHVRQALRRGRGEVEAPARVYGAVHHFALVFIDSVPKAYAYNECVRSSADRDGISGLAEHRHDTDCLTSLGGLKRYVNMLAIDAVKGTLLVRGKHIVFTWGRCLALIKVIHFFHFLCICYFIIPVWTAHHALRHACSRQRTGQEKAGMWAAVQGDWQI